MPLPLAASAEPGLGAGQSVGPGRVPLSIMGTELARTPMAGVPGDSVAGGWRPLSGRLHPALAWWQAEQRHPRAREAIQLSAAHRALRNYQRALMELDTLSWCLI